METQDSSNLKLPLTPLLKLSTSKPSHLHLYHHVCVSLYKDLCPSTPIQKIHILYTNTIRKGHCFFVLLYFCVCCKLHHFLHLISQTGNFEG